MSSHVQSVRGRTAGGGRPALATGVFLLVASLVLLVSPPAWPDAPSSTSSTAGSLAEVLVQGPGAAAVAAAGGRSLAALPIVDGLLAQVPAAETPRLPHHPGVRSVTDADRPLRVRATDPFPGGADPIPGGADPRPGVWAVSRGCGRSGATRVRFG